MSRLTFAPSLFSTWVCKGITLDEFLEPYRCAMGCIHKTQTLTSCPFILKVRQVTDIIIWPAQTLNERRTFMDSATYPDLLLFSKEIDSPPCRYKLFFAELSSIRRRKPIIHRFSIKNYKEFEALSLGTVYSIVADNTKIIEATKDSSYNLTDGEYFRLIDARDAIFLDDKSAEFIGLHEPNYSPKDVYYSYSTYKSLMQYRATPMHMFGVNLCKLTMYFLCLFLPVLLFFLAMYAASSFVQADFLRFGRAVAIPILALGALPFVIWLMTAMHTISELLMLNMEHFRCDCLRSYTLKWAGVRRNCRIEDSQKRLIIKSGIISMSFLVVCTLVVFLFL